MVYFKSIQVHQALQEREPREPEGVTLDLSLKKPRTEYIPPQTTPKPPSGTLQHPHNVTVYRTAPNPIGSIAPSNPASDASYYQQVIFSVILNGFN